MRIELVMLIQLITGFMGFLLGKAVREHDRRDKESSALDLDMRTYVPSWDRNRGGNNRRIKQVDSEGREIK